MKNKIIEYFAIKLGNILDAYEGTRAAKTLPKFKNSPKNVTIHFPRTIKHPERITMGDDVSLGTGCWLMPITGYPGKKMKHPDAQEYTQEFDPYIHIGNRVTATANLQIFAQEKVTVEDDVMFATNVFINDGFHGYQSGVKPYRYQPIFNIKPVTIKKGCWIGQNVVILPGVTIGEFTIIGANSVVTKSIPQNSIALGSPARVVKRWDNTTEQWITEKE